MIKNKNIICFASENWEYRGFQQEVMRLLSGENRILYVNALGIRKISLQILQFNHYFRRLLRLFQYDRKITKNTIVCNPWIIPLVYNDKVAKINKTALRIQLSRLLSKLHFKNYILWIGTPSAAFLLDLFNPDLLVYNPVDRYYAFPFVNSAKIRNYEQNIASRSDVIICTSEAIRKDLLPYNKHSFTVTHGVDLNHFNSVLGIDSIPNDIKDIPKPIIGYFGGLTHRVNYSLLRKIALRYPNTNIVLIGKKLMNLGDLEKLQNIHILGFKNFGILPHYLKQFSICLIPYNVDELMEGVDPIKLREYLCLGKPVVSVDLPEVRKFEDLIYIGANEEDYIAKVGKALDEKSSSLIDKRMHAARQSDWSVKMEEISDIFYDTFARTNFSKDVVQRIV